MPRAGVERTDQARYTLPYIVRNPGEGHAHARDTFDCRVYWL